MWQIYCVACAPESGAAIERGAMLARDSEPALCYARRIAGSQDPRLVFPHERYGGIGD
jgi:hypothetical protein